MKPVSTVVANFKTAKMGGAEVHFGTLIFDAIQL